MSTSLFDEIKDVWSGLYEEFTRTDTASILSEFVDNEYQHNNIFPKRDDLFKAFMLTPFSQVKVVILGQDPYHDEGQAHGLCFSVTDGVAVPPSLKNIYKEIEADTGVTKNITNGDLSLWAGQGVFLLNSILTVKAHMPLSHKNKGWETFTDLAIRYVSEHHEHVVFMLWGRSAQEKRQLIDASKHLILEAHHPSPLSAYKGFFGCKHFSICNAYLKRSDKGEIIW